MTYDPSGGYPDLITIRNWIQVPATVLDDASLEVLAGGEQTAQSHLMAWAEPLPDDLLESFFRRVARAAAAKGVPLGILAADAEYGTVRLAQWDGEINRLEAPYMIPVIA